MTTLLEVQDLGVKLPVDGVLRPVIHDVSLAIAEGEAVGLVGESGSGKTMTARAIARLLPRDAQVSGRISFEGESVANMRGPLLRSYRTNGVAMIFQDPRVHVNPVRTIGDFLTEAMRTILGLKDAEARARAIDSLGEVGIEDGDRRMRQYPHELSGGMLQRVMIAAALLASPKLILADEPTTALDVTTQAEVMTILDELRRERGLAMLFITHDLELAAAVCDRTCVMYAGSIVEKQPSSDLNDDPRHPYTAALLAARPSVGATRSRLHVIPGKPLSAFEAPVGCAFGDRCPYAEQACHDQQQELVDVEGVMVRCRRARELRGTLNHAASRSSAL